MDVGGDARTIGRRLRQIRKARRKSLVVVAELAGISTATLSRIEKGLRALDRHSEIVALATALEISPSELIRVPVPAWGNGHTDSATEAVRHALMAASDRLAGGQVLGVDAMAGSRSPDVCLGDTMTISSCHEIRPEGGSPRGRFTLKRTTEDKWCISAHKTETC